jgi:asparagine synthetase A
MLLLKKAHLGEVTVSVWPKVLKDCARNVTFTSSSRLMA